MKVHQLLEEALVPTTLHVHRGITGKLADMARNHEPLPLSPYGANYWTFHFKGEKMWTRLRSMGYDVFDNYSTPDGVLIGKTIKCQYQAPWYTFPPGWAAAIEGEGIDVIVGEVLDHFPQQFKDKQDVIRQFKARGTKHGSALSHIKPDQNLHSDLIMPQLLYKNGRFVPVLSGIISFGVITDYKILLDSAKLDQSKMY